MLSCLYIPKGISDGCLLTCIRMYVIEDCWDLLCHFIIMIMWPKFVPCLWNWDDVDSQHFSSSVGLELSHSTYDYWATWIVASELSGCPSLNELIMMTSNPIHYISRISCFISRMLKKYQSNHSSWIIGYIYSWFSFCHSVLSCHLVPVIYVIHVHM
jgi:hypothetical protein